MKAQLRSSTIHAARCTWPGPAPRTSRAACRASAKEYDASHGMQLLSSVSVVLVSPKHAANVGACLRAADNFECCDVRVVAPRCDVWSDEVAIVSCQSPLLRTLRMFPSLQDALRDTAGGCAAGPWCACHAALARLRVRARLCVRSAPTRAARRCRLTLASQPSNRPRRRCARKRKESVPLFASAGSIGFTRRAGGGRVTHASLRHLLSAFPDVCPTPAVRLPGGMGPGAPGGSTALVFGELPAATGGRGGCGTGAPALVLRSSREPHHRARNGTRLEEHRGTRVPACTHPLTLSLTQTHSRTLSLPH